MGLDIRAYSKIEKIDCHYDEDGEPIDKDTGEGIDYDFRAYINPDFPDHAADIQNNSVYLREESHGFRAGSYSGYNRWREELAKMAGYPLAEYEDFSGERNCHAAGAWDAESGPFWELILFSNCEGIIGSKVSEKLYSDFCKHEESARMHGVNDGFNEWFYKAYLDWKKAFELAANGGAVVFC